MSKQLKLEHRFVTVIPDTMEPRTLYVSLAYATAVHSCACGGGQEVVTPLSPRDWSVVFDGETVSLTPSIGNWSFPCRSHYWVPKGKVVWIEDWDAGSIW